MKDMECPYCGAEWESDVEDHSIVDNDEEYECPECGKVMIMSGEIEVNYYSEKAEDYYERKIRIAKKMLSLYEKRKDEATNEQDKKYYQNMIDIYYRPDVEKAEAALERCREINGAEVTDEL